MMSCIVCGAEDWEPQWDVLCRCKSCGFMRAAELLSPADAAGIYTEDYFSGKEYGDYLADREVHVRNFAARWRDMRRIAGEIPSVFEIGCAYGLFLEYASSQGAKAAGIDVSAPAVEHAAKKLGQQAIVGDILSAPIASGEYRAFCLWDTIEHLPHAEAVVARAARLLPSGGWLFLTTGDIGSLLARLRGRRWRMIHPPSHLQYFSRQTMRQFLARQGLTVVEIRSVSVYRTLQSVLSGLRALGRGYFRRAASLLSRAVPAQVQQRIGMQVNLGDIMFVAARRK